MARSSLRRFALASALALTSSLVVGCADDKVYEDGELTWEGSAPLVVEPAGGESGPAWTTTIAVPNVAIGRKHGVFVRFPDLVTHALHLQPSANQNGSMVASAGYEARVVTRSSDGRIAVSRHSGALSGTDVSIELFSLYVGLPDETLTEVSIRLTSTHAKEPVVLSAPLAFVVAEGACIESLTSAWNAELKGYEPGPVSPEPRCVRK